MSAQINLLSDEERHHPGAMLLRTLLGTVSLVAVAALVLYGALAYLLLTDARGSQQRAESQWNRLKPDAERAERLQAVCEELDRLQAELAAFSNVQVSAAARLLQLAACVPAEIQLTEVEFVHVLVSDEGQAARQHTMEIAGRTATDGSDARVEAFLQALREWTEPPGFGAVMPGSLRVDPQARNGQESLFQIRGLLEPRRYR